MSKSAISVGPDADPKDWRIEMLALNSGFSGNPERDDFGLRFGGPGLNGKTASIRSVGDNAFAMRVPALVASEMRKDAETGAPFTVDPAGLINFVDGGADVDKALRRAAALMRALPDTPLAIYREKTRHLPTTTEVERLAKQRVGQDVFRASMEDYWGGCCPITGISDRALLRASHTKPWALCEADEERLDVYNGFLLAVHWDAAFDAALVTFDDDGAVKFSSKLSARAREVLGEPPGQVRLAPEHRKYLDHHRGRFRA